MLFPVRRLVPVFFAGGSGMGCPQNHTSHAKRKYSMSVPKPDSHGDKRPDPRRDELVEVIYDDSPGDTTVRPARPGILKEYPRPQLPPKEPPSKEPPPPEKP